MSRSSRASKPDVSRRRDRSTRLLRATLLLVLAAVVVIAAIVVDRHLMLIGAGIVAVLLGGGAVATVWNEVVHDRRLAAHDRAEQARGYRELSATRSLEHNAFATEISGRLARHQATIGRLETRLGEAAVEVSETHRTLGAERDRATRTIAALTSERDRTGLELTRARQEREQATRVAEHAAAQAAAQNELRHAAQGAAHTADVSALLAERDRARARLDDAEERAAQAILRVAELEQELDLVLAEWRSGRIAPQRKHA